MDRPWHKARSYAHRLLACSAIPCASTSILAPVYADGRLHALCVVCAVLGAVAALAACAAGPYRSHLRTELSPDSRLTRSRSDPSLSPPCSYPQVRPPPSRSAHPYFACNWHRSPSRPHNSIHVLRSARPRPPSGPEAGSTAEVYCSLHSGYQTQSIFLLEKEKAACIILCTRRRVMHTLHQSLRFAMGSYYPSCPVLDVDVDVNVSILLHLHASLARCLHPRAQLQ